MPRGCHTRSTLKLSSSSRPQVASDAAVLRTNEMRQSVNGDRPGSRLTNVLTDVQFWVPVAVLIGGLLLLKSIH
jgi:hypothetical protein